MITVGSRVGGYTILQQLGQGGMGQVFLAQHHRIARRAAVKVLLPELSANQDVVERFFTEARATSLIRHPGIVEVLDCDVQDGQAYIVMEALEGESLADYLTRTRGLGADLPFALAVVGQVALAVGTAHAAGIVHRDLKPDNIFLSIGGADGRPVPKVLDFGIAKLTERGSSMQTRTGALLGTPTYMSPEQCRGGSKAVDGRSDIYSLGCILYEALAGRPPFVGDGVGDLIVAHVSETPAALRGLVPDVPLPVDALVMRMLAKSASDRPSRMDLVAGELAACLAALGATSPFAEIVPRSPVIIPVTRARARAVPPTTPFPTPPAGPGDSGGAVNGTRLLPDSNAAAPVPQPTQDASTTFRNTVGERWTHSSTGPKRRGVVRTVLAAAAVAGSVAVFAVRAHRSSADPPRDTRSFPTSRDIAPPAEDNVTIDVQGLPPAAELFLDGERRPEQPLRLPRGHSRHRLLVRAPGYQDRTVDLDATHDRVVDLVMVSSTPAAPPPDRGPLQRLHPERRGNASAKPRRAESPVGQPSPPTSPSQELSNAAKPTQTRPSRSSYDDM